MPGRDASSVATTVGGVYSEDGQIGSIRGSRTEGTATFVDGIRLLSPKYETLNKSKSTIKVLSWMPHAPYMEELRKANDDELLAIYYKLKDENKNRPSFYIQVADLFFVKGKHKQAVRILSNTIELDLENPELLKVVARRLLDEKEYEMSIKIFTEIKDLRPEEPQSYRDLALAYTKNKQYQKALDMHLHILNRKWGRFEEIKEVVFNEFNWLIALHGKDLDLSEVNKDYIKSMPLDIRISIDWSSNNNDIDLWVVDPNGEKCYYKNRFTKIGGKLSKDFTQGYGPEEFSIKKAKRGFYTIYVNYYSESRQSITGPVTVYAELITHYGTDKQKTERIAIQLENDSSKKTVQIGQLEFNE
jgi:tetratricopeptide (TPR) repeat protein